VAFANKFGVIVVQPVRSGPAEARPFVAGALREAFQVDKLFIEIDTTRSGAALEFCFAKSGDGLLDVDNLPANFEDGVHVVEVRILGAPEARAPERARRGQRLLFAICDVHRIALEPRADLPAMIDDHYRETHSGALARIVADLGVDGDVGRLLRDVEVGSMHVNAAGLETVIERQCLVDLADDVQPDMPVDAAMVGIEIVRIPFKRSSSSAFLVVRAVVHLHRQHVLLGPEAHCIADVDAVGGNSVLIQADRFPIEENVAGLAHAFEFEKDFAAREAGRKFEVLAVPGEPLVGSQVAAAVRDDLPERVDIVEAVGRADGCPMRIVEVGSFRSSDVLTDKFPVQIEVDPGARRLGRYVARGLGLLRKQVRPGPARMGNADAAAASKETFGARWEVSAWDLLSLAQSSGELSSTAIVLKLESIEQLCVEWNARLVCRYLNSSCVKRILW
jgi:hypothetical protein